MRSDWDQYFLDLCIRTAKMSKDPNTKVGAFIVNSDHQIISSGYNGFPRLVCDSEHRWTDRVQKHQLVIHAELNAILQAARHGTSVVGATLYLTGLDVSRDPPILLGGHPCNRCAAHIAQVGIMRVISCKGETTETWRGAANWSPIIFHESGVQYKEVALLS